MNEPNLGVRYLTAENGGVFNGAPEAGSCRKMDPKVPASVAIIVFLNTLDHQLAILGCIYIYIFNITQF